MSGNGGRQSYSSIGASNRDPEMFDRPEEVIIDREENRHFAFGIDSPLPWFESGVMELVVAMEEWLKRFRVLFSNRL